MTFNLNTLIAIGVGAQLLGQVAKAVFTKPTQQAQIDSIESKIDNVLQTVSTVLPSTTTTKGASS